MKIDVVTREQIQRRNCCIGDIFIANYDGKELVFAAVGAHVDHSNFTVRMDCMMTVPLSMSTPVEIVSSVLKVNRGVEV